MDDRGAWGAPNRFGTRSTQVVTVVDVKQRQRLIPALFRLYRAALFVAISRVYRQNLRGSMNIVGVSADHAAGAASHADQARIVALAHPETAP
jgi:hypothetical protein